ncbi:MAG: UTP--glucose-1-phosphate uridylyltransferase [Candidatus Heimdallarchaeota archaeon LC_3]|nr:MAG: UTP--glucose-1-phosphate uridylyltransferase [Candidatus Heimdallarchaeota archaeon LC_3]
MKGVILAAGYGTRFLPVTKTLPKEMFPLVTRPVIEFIVEEFIESGINDILIVTSRRKKVIEDYFDQNIKFDNFTKEKKIIESINKRNSLLNKANIVFTRQKSMKGTAQAIYLSRSFVADDSFIVAYPDDLFICDQPLSKQLINAYEKSNKNVLSLVEIPKEEVSRYGIVEFEKNNKTGVLKVTGMVEKPKVENAPSNLMSAGRYLFKSEIFDVIKTLSKKWNYKEELTQTSAIRVLTDENKVIGHIVDGKRLDIGQPLGYIKAFTQFALNNSSYKEEYLKYLQELVHR